jgi:hypothetical protein
LKAKVIQNGCLADMIVENISHLKALFKLKLKPSDTIKRYAKT